MPVDDIQLDGTGKMGHITDYHFGFVCAYSLLHVKMGLLGLN